MGKKDVVKLMHIKRVGGCTHGSTKNACVLELHNDRFVCVRRSFRGFGGHRWCGEQSMIYFSGGEGTFAGVVMCVSNWFLGTVFVVVRHTDI